MRVKLRLKKMHKCSLERSTSVKIYGCRLLKALQGEIKNVTDPRAAAAFNSRELKGAPSRRRGQRAALLQH